MANIKTENLVDIETEYVIFIDKIYGKTFNVFLKLRLIEIDKTEQGIKYIDKGLCFLNSDFVKKMCDEMPDKVLEKGRYKELIITIMVQFLKKID